MAIAVIYQMNCQDSFFDILHDNLKHIMLGHLSKENNYARLAYETVKLEVTLADNEYKGEDLNMFVASRESVSDIINV